MTMRILEQKLQGLVACPAYERRLNITYQMSLRTSRLLSKNFAAWLKRSRGERSATEHTHFHGINSFLGVEYLFKINLATNNLFRDDTLSAKLLTSLPMGRQQRYNIVASGWSSAVPESCNPRPYEDTLKGSTVHLRVQTQYDMVYNSNVEDKSHMCRSMRLLSSGVSKGLI